MLISGICITICYTAYSLVGDYYLLFQKTNSSNDRVLSLKHVLENDFLKADVILKNEDGITLQMDSTAIVYAFAPALVVRKLGLTHADTFKLQTAEIKCFFENGEVIQADTLDRVDLSISFAGHLPLRIRAKKYYSAQQLFK